MTRLGQWGAELGHEHAEGLTLAGTTLTFDTGTKRTGARSYKFTTSAANNTLTASFTGVAGRGYYTCGHFLIPAASGLPGTDAAICQLGGSNYLVRLTAAGKIQFLQTLANQIGVDSAATITTDTWYRVEIFANVGSGSSDDSAEMRLDGVTVGSETNATRTTTAPTGFQFGWIGDPGTSEVIFWDDLAVNDDQGSVNNTWVGNQKIYALLPVSDNARANWTGGAGGTTNLFEAVNNTPPTGVAVGAASTDATQIENPTSGTASYDANLTDYTTAGIGASDTVTAIQTVIEAGSNSTTGSDTMTHEMVSNPTIAASGTNNVDIVAGTYPASWNRGVGTLTENPTVTLATAPVMRVTKTAAVTRIHTVCLMALVVAVQPGEAKSAPDSQAWTAVSTATVAVDADKSAPDSQAWTAVSTATVAVAVAAGDTQAWTATDTATAAAALAAPDTQAWTAISTATKEEDVTPKQADDTQAWTAISTAAGVAALTAADTQAWTATDSATFTYPTSAADTQAWTAVSTATVMVPKQTDDTQAWTAVDATSVVAAITAPDTQAWTATDSATFAYAVSAPDTQAWTAISTATVDMTEPKLATDSQAWTAVSTASMVTAITVADTQAWTATDHTHRDSTQPRSIMMIG